MECSGRFQLRHKYLVESTLCDAQTKTLQSTVQLGLRPQLLTHRGGTLLQILIAGVFSLQHQLGGVPVVQIDRDEAGSSVRWLQYGKRIPVMESLIRSIGL